MTLGRIDIAAAVDKDGRGGTSVLNSFIGRERDLQQIAMLLDSGRLVTLIGPVGVGKSRLAAQVAERYGAESARSVEMTQRGAWETYRAALSGGAQLVVLDNCDAATSIAGQFVTFAFGRAPTVKLLATSNERLGVPGEVVWQVRPLDESSSVVLFVDRARAAVPLFELTSEYATDVYAICRALDGLPRAVELAASRIGVIGPRHILERLDAAVRLRPTAAGEQMLPAESMGASLDLCVGRLDAQDRELLWRLAVFPDSFDAAAVIAPCTARQLAEPALRASLSRLVARSLVQTVDGRDGTDVRYRLLKTVRRYALGQLDGVTLEAARRSHAEWYRQVVEGMEFGRGAANDIALLREEQPNLESALAWAVDAGETDIALTLANYLHGVWYIDGRFDESRAWLTRVLQLPGGEPRMRIRVTSWASHQALAQGDFAAALALSNQVLRGAVVDGDPVLHAIALGGLALILLDQGQLARARATFEEERTLCLRLGLTWLECAILPSLAAIQLEAGEIAEARDLAEQALMLLGQDGNAWMQVRALHVLGRIAFVSDEHRVAEAHLRSALEIARQIEDARGTIEVLIELAGLEYARGDARAARDRLLAALDVAERCGEALAFVRIVEGVVALRALTRPEAVVRLAGAATRLRAAMGANRRPREDRRFQQAFTASLARLRPATGQAAWESGQSLNRAATLGLARELLTFGEPAEPPGHPVRSVSHGLTPRELEIATRLARGLTNRAIARELLITEGTVRAHVEHILGKLGLRSRAEVAARLSAVDTPARHPTPALA